MPVQAQYAHTGRVLKSSDPPVPGRLRRVSIGAAIGFGILTLGIYVLVLAYKMSGDLHRAVGKNPQWQLWFWLPVAATYFGTVALGVLDAVGRIPPLLADAGSYLIGLLWLVLYGFNTEQLNALRSRMGLPTSWLAFILYIIPIANIAAPFVWASQYNDAAERT